MYNRLVEGRKREYMGLIVLTLAYPLTHFPIQYIPNPFVPNANIALNMIFPILAGYFYGPVSGGLAGLLGTGISAFIVPDIFDAMAILPHTLMGIAAGWAGASRSQFVAAISVVIGHALNILFYWRFDLLVIDHPDTLIIGLTTETTIDVVATILMIVLLQRWLYKETGQRW